MISSLKDIYIFSDIDGTLYSSDKGISKVNIQAVRRFIDKGGHFTIATGRAMHKTKEIAELIPVNIPAILCNGGAAYSFSEEKYLFKEFLCNNAIDYVKDIMEKFPYISPVGVSEENYYGLCEKKYSSRFHSDIIYGVYTLDNPPNSLFKVLFSVPEEECQEILLYMRNKNFIGVEFISTDTFYIDMLPMGVGKGSGIRKICKELSIPMENTVSIGDYYNDIDMLRTTQISACVGNAPQGVKDICNIILCSFSEDAVSELIVYFEKTYK